MHELLHGSDVYKKKKMENKNPEFQAYLEKLRQRQADREYSKLVNTSVFGDKNGKNWYKHLKIKEEMKAISWGNCGKAVHMIYVLIGSFLVFYYLGYHFTNGDLKSVMHNTHHTTYQLIHKTHKQKSLFFNPVLGCNHGKFVFTQNRNKK